MWRAHTWRCSYNIHPHYFLPFLFQYRMSREPGSNNGHAVTLVQCKCVMLIFSTVHRNRCCCALTFVDVHIWLHPDIVTAGPTFALCTVCMCVWVAVCGCALHILALSASVYAWVLLCTPKCSEVSVGLGREMLKKWSNSSMKQDSCGLSREMIKK